MAKLIGDKRKKKLRAVRELFWLYDRAAARAGQNYMERAAAFLPKNFLILRFTESEIRRIDRAAKICGWEGPDCPASCTCHMGIFARQLVIGGLVGVLDSPPRRRRGTKR
jgi:hypothetical protein